MTDKMNTRKSTESRRAAPNGICISFPGRMRQRPCWKRKLLRLPASVNGEQLLSAQQEGKFSDDGSKAYESKKPGTAVDLSGMAMRSGREEWAQIFEDTWRCTAIFTTRTCTVANWKKMARSSRLPAGHSIPRAVELAAFRKWWRTLRVAHLYQRRGYFAITIRSGRPPDRTAWGRPRRGSRIRTIPAFLIFGPTPAISARWTCRWPSPCSGSGRRLPSAIQRAAAEGSATIISNCSRWPTMTCYYHNQ